jgi:hypothetical protein
MEKISFNQEELRTKCGEASTLALMTKCLEKEFFDDGAVVCRVFVNGTALSEEDEYRFRDLRINEIQNLDFEIADADILVLDLVENWIRSLPMVVDSCEKVSEQFRLKGVEGSLRLFTDVIDACQYLVDSLGPLQVYLRLRDAEFARRWRAAESSLNKATIEIFSAFERQDYVFLADLLEYDLLSSLQEWESLMKSLRMQEGQGAPTTKTPLDRSRRIRQ